DASADAHVPEASSEADANAADGAADANAADGAADAIDPDSVADASEMTDAASSDHDEAEPPLSCDGPGARFITDIVSYQFGDGQDFGRDKFPAVVFGPPKGGGCCAGSSDVVSIGNGGSVAVGFAGNVIVDRPGPDFLVFEN